MLQYCLVTYFKRETQNLRFLSAKVTQLHIWFFILFEHMSILLYFTNFFLSSFWPRRSLRGTNGLSTTFIIAYLENFGKKFHSIFEILILGTFTFSKSKLTYDVWRQLYLKNHPHNKDFLFGVQANLFIPKFSSIY